MKKRRFMVALLLAAVTCIFFACPVGAAEQEQTMPDEYRDYLDALPEGVVGELPEGVQSEDIQNVSDAVSEMSGAEYLLSALFVNLGKGFSAILPHVALLVGAILVSAIGVLMSSHMSPSASGVFELCSKLSVFLIIGRVSISVLEDFRNFFSSLCGVMATFIPLSATLYTMGGNIGTAAKSGSGLLITLGIVEFISGVVVVPLFCFCLIMSMVGSMTNTVGVGGMGASVKKIFLGALGVLSMILSLSLSTQTLIASKADNLAMKGARMFLGGIPVAGGAVSSGIGTLASSIELIRGVVGIGGIIVVMLMLLPIIIELWLIRTVYMLLSNFAGTLGMAGEQKILSEVSELYGILEGVSIMCSAVFLIAMAVLCRSSAAIG